MGFSRIAEWISILAVFALATGPVFGASSSPLSRLEAGERARVVEVVDGDTVLLDDGWQVRLVGIQAPKLPLGRKNFQKWPLADESKVALVEMVMGRDVLLAYGGRRVDRHGRRLAHLFRADGVWIQGELLSRGRARVDSFPDNRAVVGDMLALEMAARQRRVGIWGNGWYAVRAPEETESDIGSFQLVEGRVVDAADVRGTVYLNFGANWRSDFTVRISKADWKRFAEDGLDPLSFANKRIRVRGWLDERNGPMIEATHPEQIELLEN